MTPLPLMGALGDMLGLGNMGAPGLGSGLGLGAALGDMLGLGNMGIPLASNPNLSP